MALPVQAELRQPRVAGEAEQPGAQAGRPPQEPQVEQAALWTSQASQPRGPAVQPRVALQEAV